MLNINKYYNIYFYIKNFQPFRNIENRLIVYRLKSKINF